MKYSGFRRDVKCHVLTFSTSGQREVTTCCICAVTSRKKCHVSGCRRQAGDVCCLRCLISTSAKLGEVSRVELNWSRINTLGFPVAQHYNSAGHSITDVQMRGMRLRGTVQPDGLNIRLNCLRATFYAYELPFNVVTNILRIVKFI